MKIIVNNIKTDYLKIGKGPTLVFLHGWIKDINKEKYQELLNLLSKKYEVVALDLPGFGKTDTPKKAWNVSDYASFVNDFLSQLKIKKCTLAGHSFGGRITIKLSSQQNKKIEKIILIDSAGIERKSLKVKLISKIASLTPKFIKNKLMPLLGSKDYVAVDGIMRQIFKNIVNENLESELPKIKVPTLIIWGQEDHTTPLYHAKIMENKIPQSTLVIVPEANHGLPYRQASETAQIIKDLSK